MNSVAFGTEYSQSINLFLSTTLGVLHWIKFFLNAHPLHFPIHKYLALCQLCQDILQRDVTIVK